MTSRPAPPPNTPSTKGEAPPPLRQVHDFYGDLSLVPAWQRRWLWRAARLSFWLFAILIAVTFLRIVHHIGFTDGRLYECRVGFDKIENYGARADECERRILGEARR